MAHDTIVALATAPGRAAVGVVRVSGPLTRALSCGLLGRLPEARRASLAEFKANDGQPLDSGLVIFFPGPYSYTGEDVLELQGHGGQAVLGLVLRRCLELGARLAEPGEFTRRAFLNGKLDLTQAEAVADLIDAGSSAAARGAIRSLQGEFSRRVASLVGDLVDARVLAEAWLDFPEEDIDPEDAGRLADRVVVLGQGVAALLREAAQGRLLRDGARVVLVGPPNVGKSSLLNQLAGEDVAIVTDVPGTTRDALREHVVLNGVPIHVIDTAGLRDTADRLERLGIERTLAALATADLALVVADARSRDHNPDDAAILARLPPGLPQLKVWNKVDLLSEGAPPENKSESAAPREVWVSARTAEGLDGFRRSILAAIGWEPEGESTFLARERHLAALRAAQARIQEAGAKGLPLELVAEGLRLAQRALEEITGEFSADDLLGEIFGRFCIGK